jgi:hypothetical protein
MSALESWSLLVAMSRLCQIAYRDGLEALTPDEQKAVLCYVGFNPAYLPGRK